MDKKKLSILVLQILVLSATACGGAEPQPAAPTPAAAPAAAKPAPGAKPAAAAAQVPEEPPPALAVPQGYRYQAEGRRDPFVNPVPPPVTRKESVIEIPRPDGLPGVLLSETKVAGIVFSKEPGMTKVFLQTPRRTYTASRGDALFDAVIKEIRQDGVVFTMVAPDTRQPTKGDVTIRAGGTSAGE